jgi:transcriptional regulator with XRE-family HTH domain
MPRKGPAYPISKEWQDEVRARISEMGIKQNELARRAGIAISSLSEALKDGAVQTTVMKEINEAVGLPPPVAFTPDNLELNYLWDNMDERARGELIADARRAIGKRKR